MHRTFKNIGEGGKRDDVSRDVAYNFTRKLCKLLYDDQKVRYLRITFFLKMYTTLDCVYHRNTCPKFKSETI